jgi:hypothetical protein
LPRSRPVGKPEQIADQIEHFKSAHDDGDDDRHGRDREVVIELPDRLHEGQAVASRLQQ